MGSVCGKSFVLLIADQRPGVEGGTALFSGKAELSAFSDLGLELKTQA